MYKKSAFTLVEMIVTTTIIVIIGTISFVSFSNSLPDSRDAQRISDFSKIESAMKVYKQNKGAYPVPWNNFQIFVGSGNTVAYQGKLNQKVPLSTINSLPLDPKLEIPYTYSITRNRWEFQLAGTLENSDNQKAVLRWDFLTVSKTKLPTISLAATQNTDVNVDKTKFILDENTNNLPYDFVWNIQPTSDDIPLAEQLSDIQNNFSTATSYRSCAAIQEDKKNIWNGEYQILSSSWDIVNIECIFDNSLLCPINTDYQEANNRCYAADNSACSSWVYNIATSQCESWSIETIARTVNWNSSNIRVYLYRMNQGYEIWTQKPWKWWKNTKVKPSSRISWRNIYTGNQGDLFSKLALKLWYSQYSPSWVFPNLWNYNYQYIDFSNNTYSCPSWYIDNGTMCERNNITQVSPSCSWSTPLRDEGKCYAQLP